MHREFRPQDMHPLECRPVRGCEAVSTAGSRNAAGLYVFTATAGPA